MWATVNPCGFALLPAYLTAFVGLESHTSRARAVARALAVSMVLTAGFVTVFGLIGIVFGSAVNRVLDHAPWITITAGLVVVALGVWLLLGHEMSLSLPKLDRGGTDARLVSMYLFGVSYAIASLSCSILVFTGVTAAAASANFVSRLVAFVLFGIGMGLVIAVLTVSVALARTEVVAHFRRAAPMINRVAGVLTVLAGLYVVYYGWYEYRLRTPGNEDDPVVGKALDIQTRLQRLMPNVGNYGWYVVGALLLLGAAVVWSRSTSDVRHDTSSKAPDVERVQ